MSTLFRFQRQQRGVAAVEFAILLPLLVLVLTSFMFFARFFWHYTVAQKAAYDAARYLSTIATEEMRNVVLARAAAGIASNIVQAEIAELRPGRNVRPWVEIQCGGVSCEGVGDAALPRTVSVTVRMDMFDDYFGVVDVGRYGIRIFGRSEQHYVGNQ